MTLLKRFVSSILFTAVLWAFALAASPELHAWAHGDEAGHEEHECAATMLATGNCDAPSTVPVVVAAPIASVVAIQLPKSSDVPVMFLVGGTLEHGPPVAGI